MQHLEQENKFLKDEISGLNQLKMKMEIQNNSLVMKNDDVPTNFEAEVMELRANLGSTKSEILRIKNSYSDEIKRLDEKAKKMDNQLKKLQRYLNPKLINLELDYLINETEENSNEELHRNSSNLLNGVASTSDKIAEVLEEVSKCQAKVDEQRQLNLQQLEWIEHFDLFESECKRNIEEQNKELDRLNKLIDLHKQELNELTFDTNINEIEERLKDNSDEIFKCVERSKELENLVSEVQVGINNLEQNMAPNHKLNEIKDSVNDLHSQFESQIIENKNEILNLRNEESNINLNFVTMKCDFEERMRENTTAIENCNKALQNDKQIESLKRETNDQIKSMYDEINKEIWYIQSEYNELKSNISYPFSSIELHPFHTLVYVWEIAEIKNAMKNPRFQSRSEFFPLPGYNFEAQGVLEKRCGHFCLDYGGSESKMKTQFKVHPKISFVLKDLSNNEERKDLVRTIDHLKHNKITCEKCDFGRFIRPTENADSVYVRDDKVVFEIHLETPSLASKAFSYNGVLFDKIDSYSLKKQMEAEELVMSNKSPYFYTSLEGYRIQVLMFLNTIGSYKGNGLKAVIRMLTGVNDLTATKHLNFQATITIFNHYDPTQHLFRSAKFDGMSENDVHIDIVSQSIIENQGFIKNDSLFYKVVVQRLFER